MIDVTPGSLSRGRDWNRVWLESPGHKRSVEELDNNMISRADNSEVGTKGNGFEFAMPLWQQAELVNHHMNVALYRNTDYINNKFAPPHLFYPLQWVFFLDAWRLQVSITDLQLTLFTIFNFIFVAPGIIAQLQPLFIARHKRL